MVSAVDDKPTVPSSKNQRSDVLRNRLRRYLPYLGIYAADVREAVEELERMERELSAKSPSSVETSSGEKS